MFPVEGKTLILAIDPGSSQSAVLAYNRTSHEVLTAVILPNDEVVGFLTNFCHKQDYNFVIERVASYGMAVGASVFRTCEWFGDFRRAWMSGGRQLVGHDSGGPYTYTEKYQWAGLYRIEEKMVLCGQSRAKDANIAQAIRDLYSGWFNLDTKKLTGGKNNPGPLYHVKKDLWAALAIALTFSAKLNAAEDITVAENGEIVFDMGKSWPTTKF